MAGKLTSTTLQINDSATATNNFVLKADNAGGVKLSRGNDGATSSDILSVNSAGVVSLLAPPVVPAQSMIRVSGANGWGSSSTAIRRFSNITHGVNGSVIQGSDITFADSATLGTTLTINTNGVYAISYGDCFTTGVYSGITLDASGADLTASVQSGVSNTKVMIMSTQSGTGAFTSNSTWCGYLASGSVIRPHSQAALATGTITNAVQFTITRVA